ARWSMCRSMLPRDRRTVSNVPSSLTAHLEFAVDQCRRQATDLSTTMRTHQLALSDRQCRMAELSQRVQSTIVMLVTILWAAAQKTEIATQAAWVLCDDLRRALTGARPSDAYFRETGRLADMIEGGGFTDLTGVPVRDILMPYQ